MGLGNFRFLFGTDSARRITRDTLPMNLLCISVATTGATATKNVPGKGHDPTQRGTVQPAVEGHRDEHRVWADKANLVIAYSEGMTADTSPYNPNTDWMFDYQFNAPYRDPRQAGPGNHERHGGSVAGTWLCCRAHADRNRNRPSRARLGRVHEAH